MDQLSLREALSQYYARHGLPPDGGESSRWFRVHLGRFSIPVPNPPARRRAVFFHDANHVLTGYNTIFSEGEMDIAAFEIGSGCGPYLIAWFINGFMMVLGVVTRPREAMRAFARGRKSGSIYSSGRTRDDLLSMSVASLRQELHIAPNQ